MKRTRSDDAFAAEFGRELSLKYRNREDDVTDEQFAASLGVCRPALMKYLSGSAMPSLSVVVLAFRRYGINVPYLGTPLFGKGRRSTRSAADAAQLILPFSVQSVDADIVETNLDRKSPHGFELRVRLRKLG